MGDFANNKMKINFEGISLFGGNSEVLFWEGLILKYKPQALDVSLKLMDVISSKIINLGNINPYTLFKLRNLIKYEKIMLFLKTLVNICFIHCIISI